MHIESFLLFILIAALGFVLMFGLLPKGEKRRSVEQLPGGCLSSLSGRFECELRQYLENGKKIEAIKLLRQAAGIDLKQAKTVIDLLESGRSLADIAGDEAQLLDLPVRSGGMPEAEAMAKIQSLIKEGKKIEAIKLYRECTGKGLKDAKDDIERLEREWH